MDKGSGECRMGDGPYASLDLVLDDNGLTWKCSGHLDEKRGIIYHEMDAVLPQVVGPVRTSFLYEEGKR